MSLSPVTVLGQWLGYCGGTTTEKRNGVPTEVEHDEIWAICYTSAAHVIVRYGSARSKPVHDKKEGERKKPFQPFKATPENPVPLKEFTDRLGSLEDAERAFRERIEQKTDPKRKGHQFHPIEFEQPPYHIESFVRYLRAKQADKDNGAVPVQLQAHLETFASQRTEVACEQCGFHHPVAIDLGDGVIVEPGALLNMLQRSEKGQRWLTTSALVEQGKIIETTTHALLGQITPVSECAKWRAIFKSTSPAGE